MKNLAIIPARGGSKRIPRKNIRDFLGKPIIAYSIEAALASGLFDEVMVSTDDKEIAEIAVKYGASVPFMRSEENANDAATLSDVIEEIKSVFIKNGHFFDNICCILATSPLITADLLRKGLDVLLASEADSVRPLVGYSYPVQRSFKMSTKGKVDFLYPEHIYTRSQDLEPVYHDAGMFYWMKADKGLKGNNRYGFEISEMECQDIDNERDWVMAELKFQINNKK